MRAARLHGPKDVRVEQVDQPALRPGTVAVDVAWAGICGSDLGLYEFAPFPHEFTHPLIGEKGPHVLGHEFSGHISAVGQGVTGLEIGQLVAVQPTVSCGQCAACARGEANLCQLIGFLGINGGGGGFSEQVVVQGDHVFPLPSPFTPQTGALVEFLVVARRAVRQSNIRAGNSAFIVGAGPIGLALLLTLKAQGITNIVVSELSQRRRALAADLGATVVDPAAADPVPIVRERTAGAGADAAFDASGAGKVTFTTTIDALRNGGTSVVVATFHEPIAVDLGAVMLREVHIVGSLAYNREDFEDVIRAVLDGRMDPAPMITSEIPLDELVDRGLDHLTTGSGRETEVKILVRPR